MKIRSECPIDAHLSVPCANLYVILDRAGGSYFLQPKPGEPWGAPDPTAPVSFWVMREKAMPVAILIIHERSMEIGLWVHDHHRGQGVGSLLFQKVLTWLAFIGRSDRLYARTGGGTDGAMMRRILRRTGFQPLAAGGRLDLWIYRIGTAWSESSGINCNS